MLARGRRRDARRPGVHAVPPDRGDRRAGAQGFLITEAIRGEGAKLFDSGGERFVEELLPRDEVVARGGGSRCGAPGRRRWAWTCATSIPRASRTCSPALAEAGLDATLELVPVSPAAHYMMGGIVTDLQRTQLDVAGLYAVGESSCTGLHGANRPRSNSLSECFVFGRRAALRALDEPPPREPDGAELEALSRAQPIPTVTPSTREALWRNAGIERAPEGLSELLHDPFPLARMIAACGLARIESRGAHFRVDHPSCDCCIGPHARGCGLGKCSELAALVLGHRPSGHGSAAASRSRSSWRRAGRPPEGCQDSCA